MSKSGKASVSRGPRPPKTYQKFIKQYPELGQAWELMGSAGRKGPLDERTARLVKLALAIGAMREGSVHANVRKALAMGIPSSEIEQVISLAAGTIGMPSTVAAWTWVNDIMNSKPQKSPKRKKSGAK